MIFEQLLFQAKEGDLESITDILLASGDNRHSGSGEKRQFWSTENSHLQFE